MTLHVKPTLSPLSFTCQCPTPCNPLPQSQPPLTTFASSRVLWLSQVVETDEAVFDAIEAKLNTLTAGLLPKLVSQRTSSRSHTWQNQVLCVVFV